MKPTDQDHELLLQRPIDEDTRILRATYVRVNEIPMLIESWSADGVRGSTAILLVRDVGQLTDEELQRFLTEQGGADLTGGVTISRRPAHIFVNFGFVVK